jgi:hypothetical protein
MRDFAETMTMMAVISDEEMSRSWKWRSEGLDLGVRDGYHRGLEAELAQLAIIESGAAAGEPVMVRAIWAARSGHERRSPTGTLARLDQEHAQRLECFGL